MTRDWLREPYRKLLRNPSASFRLLDALSQGIGYVLTREADDDGYLPFAASFDEGLKKLWKLITVPPRQRSIVARCIRDLLDDGMIQHTGEKLFVKNLVEINARRDAPSKPSKGASKASPKAVETTRSASQNDAEPTLSEPRADAERTVSEPSATPERTLSGPSAALERHAAEPSKPTQVRETIDSELSSRARSQVGREVGREVDQKGRRQLPPAPNSHPVTQLLVANGGVLAGSSPAIVAAGVIELGKIRSCDEQVEAAEIALEITLRALMTKGLEDPGQYFATVVEKLLLSGGLEAERANRRPREANGGTARKSGTHRSAGPVEFDVETDREHRKGARVVLVKGES